MARSAVELSRPGVYAGILLVAWYGAGIMGVITNKVLNRSHIITPSPAPLPNPCHSITPITTVTITITTTSHYWRSSPTPWC